VTDIGLQYENLTGVETLGTDRRDDSTEPVARNSSCSEGTVTLQLSMWATTSASS